MPLLAEHIWSDMDTLSAINATQDELRLLTPPDVDPGNLAYHDYDPNAVANPPALPTSVFEGVNFPEDPIKLLSVQVEVSYSSIRWIKKTEGMFWWKWLSIKAKAMIYLDICEKFRGTNVLESNCLYGMVSIMYISKALFPLTQPQIVSFSLHPIAIH